MTKLRFTNEWLRERIEADDDDVDVEAGAEGMTPLASRIADARKKAEAVTNALIDTGVSWYDCETLREEETFDEVEAGYIAAIAPSLITEMADELDRLTAEREKREAWIKELEAENDRLLAYWRRKEDETARLTAELEKAREALKPFAGAYNYYKLWHPDILKDENASCMEYGHATIGHLRTAARVHADLTGEKEKER